MSKEQNIKVWTVTNGDTCEIKVDDILYIPLVKDYISFDGKLWIKKVKPYIKHTSINRQNKLIRWLSDKKPGFSFTLNEFYNITGSKGSKKRYLQKLGMLEDDKIVESIVNPGSSTKYVLLKRIK